MQTGGAPYCAHDATIAVHTMMCRELNCSNMHRIGTDLCDTHLLLWQGVEDYGWPPLVFKPDDLQAALDAEAARTEAINAEGLKDGASPYDWRT